MGVCGSVGENVRTLRPRNITTKTSLQEKIPGRMNNVKLTKQKLIRKQFMNKAF